MDLFTGRALAIGIVVVIVIGGLIALGVRHLEGRSRRDEDAAELQQALGNPLAQEPALAGCSVRPVASISLGSRPRVELTGWVSSAALRDIAVRTVEREAGRLRRRVRIIDRLEIVRLDDAIRGLRRNA